MCRLTDRSKKEMLFTYPVHWLTSSHKAYYKWIAYICTSNHNMPYTSIYIFIIMMMLSRLHSTIAVEITHKLSQHIIMYLGKSSQFLNKITNSIFLLSSYYSKLNRCKQRAFDILTGSKLSTINTENMSYFTMFM